MDAGLSDKVKRGANFLGLYVQKVGIATFLGLKCSWSKNRVLSLHSPIAACNGQKYRRIKINLCIL